MFKGYCITNDGHWVPSVKLEDVHSAVSYVSLQRHLFKEVRIIDSEDFTVIQAIDGKITFPEELQKVIG